MGDLSGRGVRVLHIGTDLHDSPDLESVPAVGRTFEALQDRLLHRCGVPAAQLRAVRNPPTALSIAEAVSEETARAETVLLIYYVGHGLWSGGETYTSPPAAPGDSRPDWPGTRRTRCRSCVRFCGRETLTSRLLAAVGDRVAKSRPLLVLGPSGSGKSSLLRAGLPAAARRGGLEASHRSLWPRVLLVLLPMQALGALLAGAEIMGANKFGPPSWHDDSDWKGWWGPNPPFHTPTFVLTHRPRPLIEMEGGTTFHFLNAAPAEAFQTAREAADGQDVRIGGGPTVVRDFLAAGLVDHMHLVQVPIVRDG